MSAPDVYERPAKNPYVPDEGYDGTAPTLLFAVLETLAYVHLPLADLGVHPLAADFAAMWATRATGDGEESYSAGMAWELSVRVAQLESSGIPVPSFDIVGSCDDPECQSDHTAQWKMINQFFHYSRVRDHAAAVRTYARHVRQHPLPLAERAFIEYLAMLLVHVAMRVSEYRNDVVDELPPL